MKTLKRQILDSTHVDLQGEQTPREQLEQLFEQMRDPWILTPDHNQAKPPVARAYNKEFSQLDDGEWAIRADIEVFDEVAFAKYGGFSIAYLRRRLTTNPQRQPEVEVIYNPDVFTDDEIGDILDLSTKDLQIDGRELVQKALEIPLILIVKFAVAAYFAAFFGAVGTDTWKYLRQKIKALAQRKRQQSQKALTCQFIFPMQYQGRDIEVLAEVPVDSFPLLETCKVSTIIDLDVHIKGRRVQKVAIRFDAEAKRWVITYCISDDGSVTV